MLEIKNILDHLYNGFVGLKLENISEQLQYEFIHVYSNSCITVGLKLEMPYLATHVCLPYFNMYNYVAT